MTNKLKDFKPHNFFKTLTLSVALFFSTILIAQPTISNFYPKVVKSGGKVTLIGTNFNTTASNNVVWLGGAKCSIVSATATKLVVNVPTVVTHNFFHYTNIGTGLSCFSVNKLIPAFTNTGGYSYGSTSFNTGVSFTTGSMSFNTASYYGKFTTMDQDNDGTMDILIFNGPGVLDIYDNVASSGSFSTGSLSKTTLNTFSNTSSAEFGSTVLADLDGDGDLDAVGGIAGYDSKKVMKNTTTTSLAFTAQTNTNSSFDNSMFPADFNNDGMIDLASNYISPSMANVWCENTFSGSGNLGFTQWYTSLPSSPTAQSSTVCDLDKNGKVDLIVGLNTANIVVATNGTTANAGASSFSWSYSSTMGTSVSPRTIVVADFNNDSLEDIFTCGWGTTVNIFPNTSTGSGISFGSTVTASVGAGSCMGAVAADMNNDGLIDIVVSTTSGLYYIPNTTSGSTISFGTSVAIGSAGAGLEHIEIFDIDGDGLFDVVGHDGNTTLKVLRSQLNNTPTITASGTINAFSACTSTASTAQSMSVSGSNLTANITITAPTGFQVSTALASGYATSISLTQSSGSVSATTVYVRVASTATGTPSGNVTLTSTGATTVNKAVSATINALPTITGTTTIDKTGTSQLYGSGTADATTPWASATTSIATVNSSGLVTAVAVGTSVITYTANTGCSNTTTVTVLPNEFYIKSSASTAAATLSSWGPNADGSGTAPADFVAPKIFHLTNSAGTTSFTTGASNWGMYAQLDIPTGKTLNITSGYSINFSTNGTLTNSGTINGTSASIGMFGSSSQTFGGTINIGDVNIDNEYNITIAGPFTIYGSLNVSVVNTLYTGDYIVLHSDANGTARIGSMNGSISGNVTVEQYIPGGYRKFRFLAHPFNTAKNMNMILDDVDVTGTGGSSNGFTNTGTNNPSAYWFNTSNADGSSNNAGWTAFTKTDGTGTGNSWGQAQGIRALIRGAKGEGLTTTNYTPSAVTLDMVGAINVGDVTVNLSSSGSSTGQGLNLVGNPYPSPVDISSVIYNSTSASNINKTVYTRNPQTGSYVSETLSSGTPYSIPSNTCVFIKATTGTPSITFTEFDKTSSSSLVTAASKGGLFANGLRLSLSIDTVVYDQLTFGYNDLFSSSFEGQNDAVKLNNDYVNFYSLTADKMPLCVDFRKFDGNEIVPLGIKLTGGVGDKLKLFVDQSTITNGQFPYLYDLYMNKVIQLNETAIYDFEIKQSDSLSWGNGRFQLSYNGNLMSARQIQKHRINVYPIPAKNEIVIEGALPNNAVAICDLKGQVIKKISSNTNAYDVSFLSAGVYLIEILDAGNQVQTVKFIKE